MSGEPTPKRASRGPQAGIRPIYRLAPEERRRIIAAHVGERVRAHVGRHRESTDDVEVLEGTLVAVATPNTGTVADQVIIEPASGRLENEASAWAISTATLEELEIIRSGRVVASIGGRP